MSEDTKGTSEASAGASKRRVPTKPIVAAVIAVAVLAGAGSAFYVWHEQPSFCNAICHTPMDAYGKTYLDGGQDKYGNELDEAAKSSMMSYAHGSLAGDAAVTCLDCHVPTLEEQVSEGLGWISGNYSVAGTNSAGDVYLDTRTLEDLVEARGVESDSFCLNESCHLGVDGGVMARDELVEKTSALDETFNPHESVHSDQECSTCHKAHTQSVNYCTKCHDDAPVPDGWLAWSEYESLGD